MLRNLQTVSPSEAAKLLAKLAGRRGAVVEDISFPPRTNWQPQVDGVTFRRIAFGGPKLSGSLFRRGSVRNCVFQGVDLDGIRASKVDFIDCRFEDTDFGHGTLGVIEQCAFLECSILGGRLDHVTFAKSTFRGCLIERVRATKARWEKCDIENVTLSGTLQRSAFLNTSLKSVDFSAAELRDCSIMDSSVSDLTLPDRPDNFVVSVSALVEVEPTLSRELDTEGFEGYKRLAKVYAQLGPILVMSEELFEQLQPTDRETVMSALYEVRERRSTGPLVPR